MLNAIHEGNSQEVNQNIACYKERGTVNHALVMAIPIADRIPGLVQSYGLMKISAILTIALTSAFEKMNLRLAMTADQIVELADQIIDSANEDNLAIEDVMLFLQQMIRGEAGKIFDRMDIPTFFELFESYRQKRYEILIHVRDESHSQFKNIGDKERTTGEDPLDSHFSSITGRISELKDQLKEKIRENKNLKDNF